MARRFCNDCEELFADNERGICPFCDSANTEPMQEVAAHDEARSYYDNMGEG